LSGENRGKAVRDLTESSILRGLLPTSYDPGILPARSADAAFPPDHLQRVVVYGPEVQLVRAGAGTKSVGPVVLGLAAFGLAGSRFACGRFRLRPWSMLAVARELAICKVFDRNDVRYGSRVVFEPRTTRRKARAVGGGWVGSELPHHAAY
jgi:hypothetical protein